MDNSGQARAEAFLKEFVERLVERHGKGIDFVLLFGSAARGEFILGKSDVDLVIQVKAKGKVKEIEGFATRVFWELDKKHGTQLEKVCSTGIGKSLLENMVKAAEKGARLYKPFEVFGPKDIDWGNGMIKRLDLMPGAVLVASQLTLLYKMKHEGKILFGRDVRQEINPRFTLWEKLKSIWVPQSIALSSIFLAGLLPGKAVGYAVKAVFYELESASIALKNIVPERPEQLDRFGKATEFEEKFLDSARFYLELRFGLLEKQRLSFVKKALAIKKDGFAGGRIEAIRFCIKAFRIIYHTNTAIVLKTVFGAV